MKINKILMLSALAGTLGTASVAFADSNHDRRSAYDDRAALDVIGTARISRGRGEVTFTITPEMRRDGLQLQTNASGLQLRSVSFVYSDGRVVEARGREISVEACADGSMITIQRGRPPGLRSVRVSYAAGTRDRTASLQLVQIHDGDGYTHEADLWKYHQNEGSFVTADDDDVQPPARHVRVRDHRRQR